MPTPFRRRAATAPTPATLALMESERQHVAEMDLATWLAANYPDEADEALALYAVGSRQTIADRNANGPPS